MLKLPPGIWNFHLSPVSSLLNLGVSYAGIDQRKHPKIGDTFLANVIRPNHWAQKIYIYSPEIQQQRSHLFQGPSFWVSILGNSWVLQRGCINPESLTKNWKGRLALEKDLPPPFFNLAICRAGVSIIFVYTVVLIYIYIYTVLYSWWLKSCTTWDVWNPTDVGINYQPQLMQDFSRQQYVHLEPKTTIFLTGRLFDTKSLLGKWLFHQTSRI